MKYDIIDFNIGAEFFVIRICFKGYTNLFHRYSFGPGFIVGRDIMKLLAGEKTVIYFEAASYNASDYHDNCTKSLQRSYMCL